MKTSVARGAGLAGILAGLLLGLASPISAEGADLGFGAGIASLLGSSKDSGMSGWVAYGFSGRRSLKVGLELGYRKFERNEDVKVSHLSFTPKLRLKVARTGSVHYSLSVGAGSYLSTISFSPAVRAGNELIPPSDSETHFGLSFGGHVHWHPRGRLGAVAKAEYHVSTTPLPESEFLEFSLGLSIMM